MQVHVWTLCPEIRICLDDSSSCYTLFSNFLLWYSTAVCLDTVHIWLKNCNVGHFTACLVSFISMSVKHKSFITIGTRLYPSFTSWQTSFPPFPTPHNRKLCCLSDMCLESLRLHLNCKAVRIRPSLNALCDVLAESTQALWDDTCHPPSLQSCLHFTLTDEGWCCLITIDPCQGGREQGWRRLTLAWGWTGKADRGVLGDHGYCSLSETENRTYSWTASSC